MCIRVGPCWLFGTHHGHQVIAVPHRPTMGWHLLLRLLVLDLLVDVRRSLQHILRQRGYNLPNLVDSFLPGLGVDDCFKGNGNNNISILLFKHHISCALFLGLSLDDDALVLEPVWPCGTPILLKKSSNCSASWCTSMEVLPRMTGSYHTSRKCFPPSPWSPCAA